MLVATKALFSCVCNNAIALVNDVPLSEKVGFGVCEGLVKLTVIIAGLFLYDELAIVQVTWYKTFGYKWVNDIAKPFV